MFKKTKKALLLFILVFLMSAQVAQAGFGIQPPHVRPSKPIFAGTQYEQQITLLRSSADVDMVAEVQVMAPEIKDWVSIDKGQKFDLPKDQLRVPMTVLVDVPSKAPIGNYKGHLNIRMTPKEDSNRTGVAIALGARVEMDITITDENFVDFVIRRVDILDIEKLKRPWNWPIFSWFFYRVKVDMMIENTGNTKISPSRVHIDIYDNAKKELLESHNDRSIKKIDPFKTANVQATFPTKLEPGEYWGKISIYRDKEIIQKNEIIFRVYENGQHPNPQPLGKMPYLMAGSLILLALIALAILIKVKIWKYLWLIFMIVTWPIRMILKQIARFFGFLNRKFWKWMHKKASKYQEPDEDQ